MSEKAFDSVKYKNDFNRQNYDMVTVTMPKGFKEELTAAAKAAGFKSRNEFIMAAIREKMGENNEK